MAEGKEWILFFDEADALFGKRTGIKDSHDRYANQEVSYLLQRVEDYPGLVVLSTNQKLNIDDAFARRFQSSIKFPMPNAAQRKRLWLSAFSDKVSFEDALNWDEVSRRYELSGGSIMNVVQFASVKAMSRGENVIRLDDILLGIRREFAKEGKVV
jgi:SpoVK/Ycf46/Vps4 family AAA+-type ATPase